jgi:hypothetical protein
MDRLSWRTPARLSSQACNQSRRQLNEARRGIGQNTVAVLVDLKIQTVLTSAVDNLVHLALRKVYESIVYARSWGQDVALHDQCAPSADSQHRTTSIRRPLRNNPLDAHSQPGAAAALSEQRTANSDAVTPEHAQTQGIDPALLEQGRSRPEALYAKVAKSWPGFIARSAQYQMMHAALLTFVCAKTPEDTQRTGDNQAQLEAGTGTGKTVACCLAAIVASEILKKTVIVSTATVALQEQLFQKDLPRLGEVIPELHFDILKGRERYVCQSRLEGGPLVFSGDSEQCRGKWINENPDSEPPAAPAVRSSPPDARQSNCAPRPRVARSRRHRATLHS